MKYISTRNGAQSLWKRLKHPSVLAQMAGVSTANSVNSLRNTVESNTDGLTMHGAGSDEILRKKLQWSPSNTPNITLNPHLHLDKQPICEHDVMAAQYSWARSIEEISTSYLQDGDYVSLANRAASDLYAYGHSDVLFKPTKANEVQFRPTASGALSYFVGGDAVTDGITEDKGFAINGGNGWSDVVFDNQQIALNGETAIAMGNYYFKCATSGDTSKVEYTFGYRRCTDGKIRIFLHHSSVPYTD